jgi:hypothetical protein
MSECDPLPPSPPLFTNGIAYPDCSPPSFGSLPTHEDFLDSSGTPKIKFISNQKRSLLRAPSRAETGHATSTLGILGASGDNAKGIAGVAYKATTHHIHAFLDGSINDGAVSLGSHSACKGLGPNCEATADSMFLAMKQIPGLRAIVLEI